MNPIPDGPWYWRVAFAVLYADGVLLIWLMLYFGVFPEEPTEPTEPTADPPTEHDGWGFPA